MATIAIADALDISLEYPQLRTACNHGRSHRGVEIPTKCEVCEVGQIRQDCGPINNREDVKFEKIVAGRWASEGDDILGMGWKRELLLRRVAPAMAPSGCPVHDHRQLRPWPWIQKQGWLVGWLPSATRLANRTYNYRDRATPMILGVDSLLPLCRDFALLWFLLSFFPVLFALSSALALTHWDPHPSTNTRTHTSYTLPLPLSFASIYNHSGGESSPQFLSFSLLRFPFNDSSR